MNILVFSWRDPKHPLSGGAEQVMHEHMKGWVEAGNKVTLFSAKMPALSARENLDGVEIVRGGYQYLGVQLAGLLFYLTNRNNYDFIVDQFHGLPFFTPVYSRKPKLAVIQEPARDVWFKNPLIFPINWLVGLIGYLIEPIIFLLYRKVDFMTGSDSAKENLKKYGIDGKMITVVPHGVIVNKSNIKADYSIQMSKSKEKTIAYLGILSRDKGIEDAIKTFKILSSRSNYQFWVIGRGETKGYEEKIKSMAKPLGSRIKFWGHVSDSEKFELLAKAHILVNPSVHEGWGLVNIEANSVGTPVASYKSAGLVDSVKDGVSGVIVTQNTPEELAAGIREILADELKYNNLQKGAVSWSKNFSWEKSKKQSLTLLKKITGQA